MKSSPILPKILGVTPELNNVDWDGLIPGLKTGGKYDCVICGIEYTDERAREVDFSRPYYYSFEQLATRKEDPEITSLDQLRGRRAGTLDQTGAFDLLKAAGVDPKTYDEEQNAYNDCARGRLDAVLLDYPIAMYYAKPNASLRFNGPPFGHITYAIAVKKGDTAVLDALNYGLQQLIASGRLREILSRWNLWTETIAHDLNQSAEPSGPPIAYEEFLAEAGREVTWSERFQRLWQWRGTLGQAAVNTLVISLCSMLLAVVVGFFLAILRVFAARPFQLLSMTYVEVVRGTPLLIQMLFIYYGLPNIGIQLSPWVAGILGLGLNYAAYEAENYRAGLLSVPRGQMEAARALGMSRRQGLRHVVVPQAFRLVPAAADQRFYLAAQRLLPRNHDFHHGSDQRLPAHGHHLLRLFWHRPRHRHHLPSSSAFPSCASPTLARTTPRRGLPPFRPAPRRSFPKPAPNPISSSPL